MALTSSKLRIPLPICPQGPQIGAEYTLVRTCYKYSNTVSGNFPLKFSQLVLTKACSIPTEKAEFILLNRKLTKRLQNTEWNRGPRYLLAKC